MDKLSTIKSKAGEIQSDHGSRGLELSIIIVDYKSSDFTIDLLADLKKHLTNVKHEIIVVDNDPSGNAADVIAIRQSAEKQSNLNVIKAKKNLGFAAGNNLGAKEASGEYLLLLNPDIKIVDDSIEAMLDFITKHTEVGALSCLLYQPDAKTLQRHFFADFQSFAGIIFKRRQGRKALSFPRKREPTDNDFFYTDMVSGAALMVKRKLFEEIDGFDQNFFMYIEDDDFCRRLQKLGYKNAVLTTARLIHYEGQSSTPFEKKQFYYKSQDYYWQKHYGSFQTALMKIVRSPYILWQKMKSRA